MATTKLKLRNDLVLKARKQEIEALKQSAHYQSLSKEEKAKAISNLVKDVETTIYVQYCHNTIPALYNTGKKIEVGYWDEDNECVRRSYKGYTSLNAVINSKKKEIDEIVEKAQYNKIEPTHEYVKKQFELLQLPPQPQPQPKQIVKDFKYYLEDFLKNCTKVNASTRKQYNSWGKGMLEFEKETKVKLSFEKMDEYFYNRFAKYILYEKERRAKSKEDKGAYNGWFGSRIKKLKTFLKWCEDYREVKVCGQYKRFKVLTDPKEIVFCDKDEINMLYEYYPTEPDKRKLKADHPGTRVYIDLAVFACLTGLRISDIIRSDYQVINGMLQGKTKKTKGRFKIPFTYDKRIKEILDRYNWDFSTLKVSDVKFNKHIKQIWKEVYEHYNYHPKSIKVYRYKLKEEYLTTHEKYELISSHTGRRSFVSNMSRIGFSENDIIKMLGTKSLGEFRKYLANEDEFLLEKTTRLLS